MQLLSLTISVLMCLFCSEFAWMTVTTKPSPVGDDAVKQTQSPPAVNHPEGPPSSVPPCTVASADSVTTPPDTTEQPSEPDVQE